MDHIPLLKDQPVLGSPYVTLLALTAVVGYGDQWYPVTLWEFHTTFYVCGGKTATCPAGLWFFEAQITRVGDGLGDTPPPPTSLYML